MTDDRTRTAFASTGTHASAADDPGSPHDPFAPDETLIDGAWLDIYCRCTAIPYRRAASGIVLACCNYADALDAIRAFGGKVGVVEVVLFPKAVLRDFIHARFGDMLTDRAVSTLRRMDPAFSATSGFPIWMKGLCGLFGMLVCTSFMLSPVAAALNIWLIFLPYCLATMGLRLLLIRHGLRRVSDRTPPRTRTPIVSILVPVYREATSLPTLLGALERLDYPRHCLDIKIVVEADDTETRAEIARLTLDPWFDVIPVPASHPRTKPKAMNCALPFVRGEIVGIFDAEDCPEADQVSKAVATLEHADTDVVCAQARLSHYNRRDNILTRLVALEYAMWFDVLLTGLSRAKLPVPLGGTSLYFRGIA